MLRRLYLLTSLIILFGIFRSEPPSPKMHTVLVTGAGGRTGKLVVKKLAARPTQFTVRGLVRPGKVHGDPIENATYYTGDITNKDSSLSNAMQGCDSLVILTSAVPKVKEPRPEPPERPEFYYESGGMPEQVDWEGQKNQIDVAKELSVKRVVMVGSRGGTDPENMLNKIANGNILVWKRKSEKYLADSGLDYTIIRAGGLLDQPGGERRIIVGADDADLGYRSLPREDVAEMVVEALLHKESIGKSMDLVSEDPGSTAPTTDADFVALFESAKVGF